MLSMIKPLGKNILVEPIKEEEKTESGIILTDSLSKEKKAQGKVLAVGSEVYDEVEVGETIIFEKWSGEDVQGSDKEEFKIISLNKVLAIIE